MQGTVLQKIVDDKKVWIDARKATQPLASFQAEVVPSDRSFIAALRQHNPAFILECKKASPSKGLIRDIFDPQAIATVYRDYASAISVLTDEKYFQGDFAFLPIVRQAVHQPVLCKDFIIDPYQIWLARFYQADAILLMLSVLDDEQYRQLADVANTLKMGILTEVSNQEELERAIALNAEVVGINNRDLRDLSVDTSKTRLLAPQLPATTVVISESGIQHYAQIKALNHYAQGFLVGSSLMSEDDLRFAVKRLLSGENKVCGLTRAQDAQAAYQAGALYGGLIFVESSPRYVTEQQAKAIIDSAPLRYVGVFRDVEVGDIAIKVETLGLSAVQLHGSEDPSYVRRLRDLLPADCQIWKAFKIDGHLPDRGWIGIDRYIFDNGHGGSGQSFDWKLLANQSLDNVILAGGIGEENIMQALTLGCAGVDLNSAIESSPGEKDKQKLNQVFSIINTYATHASQQ
ncbi:bifunctional indole-3-glycerol-phosphate synthase TrpC/phosphoribosylanthranilate isomerase TrpF [Rosenbergiella australiborealis]|uniref:Multifunctional fusion protein n=1 Tax=Rosenbergiella australiborealis TaxID=1544696 RepID=A0ABS5T4E5_9GAMM|nr:bifunctional indole-3-glycerol-phosphate synthase TrpC/phosphoribosylanthranilate isomerase TrpF [Rosenbergiella australiborealis]MBT0726345.1 bifunctional indole-3-glycerol-phosphate synthase TrpC/phosphoribosylanthranilate isomerase TrpF [Rosenbergiella australiborealis]